MSGTTRDVGNKELAGLTLLVDSNGVPLDPSSTGTSSANLQITSATDTDGTDFDPVGRGATSKSLNIENKNSSGSEIFTDANPGIVSLGTALSYLLDSLGIGGISRTTNPTAASDAAPVLATFDKVGRQVVVLGQVRDLRASQRTVIANATETTIITATASVFHDLRTLLVANGSTTDVDVDIRDDTAGTIIATVSVKAGTTSGMALAQSIPQTAVNKNWTAQCSATPSGGNAHVVVSAFYDTNI